jgi:plasmid stabilization system protein ParE
MPPNPSVTPTHDELVYTEQALVDLERLSDLLLQADTPAAQDTAALVFDALDMLVQHPEMGRRTHFGQRELVISRGHTGYLALYRFLPRLNRVLVLALRHQREAGYKTVG